MTSLSGLFGTSPQPVAGTSNLSIFGIDPLIFELLAFREELLSDPELVGAEREDSIQATENRIREFVTALVNKADVGRYLQEFEERERIAKEEADRQRAKANRWADRYERLKMLAISVMQQTGQTRIEGPTHTLSLRKIAPSADVSQPNMVPAEYQRITVKMNNGLWAEIQAAAVMGRPLRPEVAMRILSEVKAQEPEPNKIDILAVLKSQVECSRCAGTGRIQDGLKCELCQSSGKVPGAIPGCRLVTDKQTLIVK